MGVSEGGPRPRQELHVKRFSESNAIPGILDSVFKARKYLRQKEYLIKLIVLVRFATPLLVDKPYDVTGVDGSLRNSTLESLERSEKV